MTTTFKTITIQECRFCDGTSSHRPYGMDDVAVCTSCGAEWEPVAVKYDRAAIEEELAEYEAMRNPKCGACGEKHRHGSFISDGELCDACYDEVSVDLS